MSIMTEGEIRELCNTSFDAYQDKRVDILDRVLADDCVIWHNVFGRDTTKQENLSKYHDSYRGQRRRTYDDRMIDVFHDGFVIRYQLGGVMENGRRGFVQQHTIKVTYKTGFVGTMDVCFVAYVRNGMISRIYEYFDTGQVDKFLPPRGEA